MTSSFVSHRKPVILLADNEAHLRRATAKNLEEAGCTVLQATNAQDTLRLFEKYQQDIEVALLDLVMPHCDGIEVARKIRIKDSELPIIFLSGYNKKYILGSDEPPQNSQFFPKPLVIGELIQSIFDSLRLRKTSISNQM